MIHKLQNYAADLGRINREGLPKGLSTGWNHLDELYRVQRGYMTVVTGIPGHGKSEFLDALFVNLARKHGWKFAIYSPENYPTALHVIKLVEKFLGENYSSMTDHRKEIGYKLVDDHFTFLYPKDDESKLVDILDGVLNVKSEYGCDGFILDPWNEIDHLRHPSLSETEYISQSLTKVRRLSRDNMVHSWIVAHPKMMRKNDSGGYDPPTPYDISGSAHWRNKADFCITVHQHNIGQNQMSVIVNKVKFKNFGKLGTAEFDYEYSTGRLFEKRNVPEPERHY